MRCRVLFFAAKPRDEAVFDALRREAADQGDVVVLPGIFEHYHNITHQTLEILRAASMDAVATHALKVWPASWRPMLPIWGLTECAQPGLPGMLGCGGPVGLLRNCQTQRAYADRTPGP